MITITNRPRPPKKSCARNTAIGCDGITGGGTAPPIDSPNGWSANAADRFTVPTRLRATNFLPIGAFFGGLKSMSENIVITLTRDESAALLLALIGETIRLEGLNNQSEHPSYQRQIELIKSIEAKHNQERGKCIE